MKILTYPAPFSLKRFNDTLHEGWLHSYIFSITTHYFVSVRVALHSASFSQRSGGFPQTKFNKVVICQIVQALSPRMNKEGVPIARAIPVPSGILTNAHDGAREFLSANKWPLGLQDTFVQNLSLISMRFFICDDSGSMMANDGHKLLVDSSGRFK